MTNAPFDSLLDNFAECYVDCHQKELYDAIFKKLDGLLEIDTISEITAIEVSERLMAKIQTNITEEIIARLWTGW